MAKKVDNYVEVEKSSKKFTPTQNVGVVSKQKNNKYLKKEKNVGTSIFIFFAVLVIISLAIGVVFSPAFDVTGIVTYDGVNISSGEISYIANVNIGENILKQNYRAIRENLSAMPYIKSVSIKLLLPDKIEVKYEEREPYALVKYLESYVVMDKFGYLLEIKKENDLIDLPVIYGIALEDCEPGEMLQDTDRIKYQNIVMLLETAKQREFQYNIYEIDYEKISEVKFWVKDFDIDIIYGDIDKNLIADKLNYLSEVLKKLNGKKGKLNISSDNYLEKTIFTERY